MSNTAAPGAPHAPRPPQTAGGAALAAPQEGTPVIRADHLRKHYGTVVAVQDVSFTVQPGDVFGFLGPNGAGKSTTIAMLLGLVAPTAGEVDLFGLGPNRRSEALTRVGAIIESPTFYPYLSGRDNLRALAFLRPGVSQERVTDVLEIVELSDAGGKHYGNYSLGMKQRLAIAGTLLHDPDLLILDEPTNGLDPAGMLEVRQLILALAEQGKTIFLSSHLLNEVEQVCNRVAILSKGQIMAEGPLATLAPTSQALFVRTGEPARALDVVRAIPGVSQVAQQNADLVITAPTELTPEINAALVQAGIAVWEMRPTGNTLEQVFLELTESPDAAPTAALSSR